MDTNQPKPQPKPEYEPPRIISYSEADILEELGDAHGNAILTSE